MSSGAGQARAYLSIGEVLSTLRPEFPDVTISKIRFLEAEGLISPDRTPSGYRKFSRADVSRLTFVLAAQRDRYLPLRVIKDHLDAIDRGLEPPELPGGTPRLPRALSIADDPAETGNGAEPGPVRLTRDELLATVPVGAETLDALEQAGLVQPRAGYYEQDALTVAQIAVELARYGIEPRHLRSFRTAVDREMSLFEQVVSPLLRNRNPEAHGRADESVRELGALSVRLHTALTKAGLRDLLGN